MLITVCSEKAEQNTTKSGSASSSDTTHPSGQPISFSLTANTRSFQLASDSQTLLSSNPVDSKPHEHSAEHKVEFLDQLSPCTHVSVSYLLR